jgi:hypothetical protein
MHALDQPAPRTRSTTAPAPRALDQQGTAPCSIATDQIEQRQLRR